MKKNDEIIQANKIRPSKTNNYLLKKVLLTCSASIILGLVLGFFFLQMIKQDNESTASVMENNKTNINNTSNSDGLRDIPAIDTYVIQGGVFNDVDNAEKWQGKFRNLGFSALKWKREGTFFLLVGISTAESEVKKIAETMKEEGLDVFVKPWKIDQIQIELSQTEYDWLLEFHELWTTSLSALEDNDTFSAETWDVFLEATDTPEKWQPFQEIIKDTIVNEIDSKPESNRYLLLKLLMQYEEIMQNI